MDLPWGIWFEPTQPVGRIVDLARLAEGEGASVCLVADEGTDRDVYVTMTAVLLGTERLIVAPGITNPFSRHPVATAAAIATLHEMAPGRVWNGLGVGGNRVLAPMGLTPARPFTALREAVETTKSLLAGETVGSARLPWTTGSVPTAIAGRGRRTQALAAEQAEWAILSAKPIVTLPEVAKQIRRAGKARIAWSAYVAYDEVERERVLRHFSYMALDSPPDIQEIAGLDDEKTLRVKTLMLAGDYEAAAGLLLPAVVERCAVTGTDEECAATIRANRPYYDIFVLPINDDATADVHIRRSAGILRTAARPAAPRAP